MTFVRPGSNSGQLLRGRNTAGADGCQCALRGGRIHTQWGCREVLYEERPDGETEVTGLRLTRAGKEHIAKADAYVAALDVPGQHAPFLWWPCPAGCMPACTALCLCPLGNLSSCIHCELFRAPVAEHV